jgi:hypothetical protein
LSEQGAREEATEGQRDAPGGEVEREHGGCGGGGGRAGGREGGG